MKKIIIIFSLSIIFVFSFADTHITAGNVSGVWTFPNSPYIIDGEISIQQGDELTIEPGIQVIFSGHFKLNVYGRILAEGTAADTIVFTAQDAELGWHSLRFWNTSSNGQDSSRVINCDLRLGKANGEENEKYGGAIYCNNSSDILIQDCLITKNTAESHGGGIHCSNSSPSLVNVNITGNYVIGEWITHGGGLSCTANSNPSLENVTISNNIVHYGSNAYGGGIYCSYSDPILENVTVSGNFAEGYDTYGHGIYLTNSNPVLFNVNITGNYFDSSGGSGGGIFCDNDSSPSLEDVIINGNQAHYGGGIKCSSNSNPILENVTIIGNCGADCGGGIYCGDSSPTLENVTISDNTTSHYGGGIYLISNSNPSLTNVTISGNNASRYFAEGGGIYCSDSNPSFANVTISGNNSEKYGGGIYCNNSNLNFNTLDRCNIYLNYAGIGCDLFVFDSTNVNVIVDTFTVLEPDENCAFPINNFTYDIQYSKVEQVNQDLYVSPDGSDDNSGLTADDPLLTICYALTKIIADSINTHTIHLSNGTYSPSQTGEIFPINCRSYISLLGMEEHNTILDGENLSKIFFCYNDNNFSIENMTIQNGSSLYGGDGGGMHCSYSSPSLENITLKNNHAANGGGIYCYYSNPVLRNVTIFGNDGNTACGGIYCSYSNPSLSNVIIYGNTSLLRGSGISCSNSNPILENVTISENSTYANYGCGFYCASNSNPILTNCILWNNSPREIAFWYCWNPNTITISYSDIQNGEVGIETNDNGIVNWLEGNIDTEPLFADPQNGNLHLTWANFPIPDSTMSPCIDAGDPNSIFDPDGTVADMGAYYYDQGTGTDNYELPITSYELTNYPNPFNPSTNIEFSIQSNSKVELTIFNIKGQKVKTFLINPLTDQPINSVIWNGDDNFGDSVSSGIYFYKLVVDKKTVANKKMLLLK